jgi:hypothetical protein
MKKYSNEELKGWIRFGLSMYAVGWVAYITLLTLVYLDVAWIFKNYKIFIATWVIGHLFIPDVLRAYYELLKRKDKLL